MSLKLNLLAIKLIYNEVCPIRHSVTNTSLSCSPFSRFQFVLFRTDERRWCRLATVAIIGQKTIDTSLGLVSVRLFFL